MKKWPWANSLGTKILQLLKQEDRPLRWTQLERLAPNKSRDCRSARVGKVLTTLQDSKWVKKELDGYVITEGGRHELEKRKASNLLAASAPFYAEHGKTKLVCFGDKIAEDDEKKLIDVFRQYPRLKAVSREPPVPLLDVEPIK